VEGRSQMLTEEQQRSLERKGIHWDRVSFADAADVLDALDRGEALVVDARRPEIFAIGHFPGAVNARGEEALLALSRDQALYLYCT